MPLSGYFFPIKSCQTSAAYLSGLSWAKRPKFWLIGNTVRCDSINHIYFLVDQINVFCNSLPNFCNFGSAFPDDAADNLVGNSHLLGLRQGSTILSAFSKSQTSDISGVWKIKKIQLHISQTFFPAYTYHKYAKTHSAYTEPANRLGSGSESATLVFNTLYILRWFSIWFQH